MNIFAKKIFTLLTVLSVTAIGEAAFVDHLKRCKAADFECTRDTFQTALRDIGKTGLPELGIPPIDPFPVRNVTVSLLGIIDISMVDGVAKGMKDCIVDKLETDIKHQRATMEMTCDITVKGRYVINGDSPIIKNVLNGDIVHGDGFGKVTFEKFHMNFDYHILIREEDGDTFIHCNDTVPNYKYTLGKATFAADNIYFGRTEASNLIIPALNDNWKFIMDTFGKPFLDKAMEIAYEQSHKFFDSVPTKYYLDDDLTPYITKESVFWRQIKSNE